MDQVPPARKHAHVVGVAGVGMSAIAHVLLAAGYEVSGSDRFMDQGESLEVLERLRTAGVRLVPQDGSAINSKTDCTVVSTAIEQGNADLDASRRHGVRVVHRAAMLAELARGHRCVAITGTSGKTTVTGMIGWIMEQLGADPTVVNGGVVLDWQKDDAVGNVRSGRGEWWVVEADESDKSLLNFDPEWAVITNVSKDHFELGEVIALFRNFCTKVRTGVVAGPGVRETLGMENVISEPVAPKLQIGRWTFRYKEHLFTVPVIGRHNAENAAIAVTLCDQLGFPLERMVDALSRFRGIHRRLESVGEGRGVRVIDDYAHNPAKIAASWKAVAESSDRILGFWRPHGFGPLALMKDELASALVSVCRPQDRIYVLPVFYVGGTASQKFTSEDFVRLLQERGCPAEFAPDYASLERSILASCQRGDTILAMGARDPELPRSARRIAQGLHD